MNPKLKGMLGLAMRAGKLACGESKAAEAIRGGRAELVLLSADASENTEKRFLNMTQYYHVLVLRPQRREILAAILGRSAVVLAVTDAGFAEQIKKLFSAEQETTMDL